jgi:CBS-domain-containing membrane protein
MSETRPTETMTRPPLGHSALLLFGVFTAPLAWAVQLVASYALAASACFDGGVATVGRATSRVPLVAIAIACVILAAAGLVVAAREYRKADDAGATRHPQRSRALAKVGIFSSVLFLGAIAFSIVMLSLSPHCAG